MLIVSDAMLHFFCAAVIKKLPPPGLHLGPGVSFPEIHVVRIT